MCPKIAIINKYNNISVDEKKNTDGNGRWEP
jgi:hypothetical protein